MRQPVPARGSPSKLGPPDDGHSLQLPMTDSSEPSKQIVNPNLLVTATPTRSLNASSVSSTVKTEGPDDDDKIQPLFQSSSHDLLDKSYVFAFGMYI